MFALFGTLAVLLFATLLPPYQNPDELSHFERADQVAHGGFLARRGPGAKARIDTGIDAGAAPFHDVPGFNNTHVSRSMYAPVAWGMRQVDGIPNTALYPPTFYLPAALAIRIGQRAGLSVLPTLELCRAFQGAASVVIGALAIALAGPAAVWLFAVLTLPMSLAQMAACGQDGPMIACTALAVAVALRLQRPASQRPRVRLFLLCTILALVGAARPPYAAFVLLVLLAAPFSRRVRVLSAALTLGLIAGWCIVSLQVSGLNPGRFNNSDSHAQLLKLLHAPWRVITVAWRTFHDQGQDYLTQFIGQPASLDLILPYGLRLCAGLLLGWAAFLAWRSGAGKQPRHAALTILLAVLASVALMMAVQYLTWTPPGADRVEGLQGRYFLPPVLVFGLVVARPVRTGSRFAAFGAWPLAVFPGVTIVVCVHAILLRYYL